MSIITISSESKNGALIVRSDEVIRAYRVRTSAVSSFLDEVIPLGVSGDGDGEYDDPDDEIWMTATYYGDLL